jgi:CHAT domain-containing protein/tetratricopeptide (TPR) repeat protein
VSSAANPRFDVEPLAEEVLHLLRVEPARALDAANRLTALADSSPEPMHKARALWVRGHALAGVLRNREAFESYRDAADIYGRLGKEPQVARIAIGQVNALTYLGRYREAVNIGERARRILLKHRERAAAARMDLNLGNIDHRCERPDKALARYDRSLRAARQLNDASMERIIQLNRATALSALGRFEKAEKLYREVGTLAEACGETRIKAFVDFNLGYVHFRRGEYALAHDTLDSARQSFEALGDQHFLALTLVDLTELFLEVNAFPRALDHARRAFQLASSLGLRFEMGRTTLFQAIASIGLGDLLEAEERLKQAASFFREEGNDSSEALTHVYLAELEHQRGETRRACQRLKESIQTFRSLHLRLQEATALLRLAQIRIDKGTWKDAALRLEEAGKILRRGSSPWLSARHRHLAGRVAQLRGQTSEAIALFEDAAQRIEKLRGRIGIDEFRVSFALDKAPVYADLVAAILAEDPEGGIAPAFAWVERARSRALVDLLAARISASKIAEDPAAAKVLSKMEALRSEINRLSGMDGRAQGEKSLRRVTTNPARIRDLESELADLLRRVERRSARWGALTGGETMTLEETQASLDSETVLVEYFLTPQECCAFVVRSQGCTVVRLPTTSREVESRIQRIRFQVEKGCFGEDYTQARGKILDTALDAHFEDLARKIWHPLEIEEERVIVVPYGALHSVPFAALPEKDGRRVVDGHILSYLPSASCRRYLQSPGRDARRNKPSSAPKLSMLAVEAGDEEIPETRREVDVLKKYFPKAQVLSRGEATRSRFRELAQDADVIHIAAHSIFRSDDPSFSSIQLRDGWMGLPDIFGLRLRARLVCLSSCQSGRNWVGGGDELVGLTRGFFHAGAASLLVSLWPVHDRATSELMIQFYRGVREGLPLAHSLSQAMKETRERSPYPGHWAPFILVGAQV